MPSLSLTLCGGVKVAGNGVAADAIGAKSLALLAYVALEPGAHTRDELTALLVARRMRNWPGVSSSCHWL